MTAFSSKHKRRSTFLVLAVAMLLSFCLCFITACDDESSSSTGTSTTKTDNCTIANGNFEYYNDDDNLKLIVSPSSWTKSNGQDALGNSASASTKTSGIVNTNGDNWDDLTKSKKPYEIAEGADVKKAMTEAASQWDDMSIYDRLHFYEDLEDAIDTYNDDHDDSLSLSDFEEYGDYTYSITADDIPDCENPGTHDGNEDETSVLMLHNYRTDGYGTAQKYTSSTTVTLKANTSAKVSVWVKTMNMTYDNGEPVDGLRGANINITHTVGGKALEQMQIKNINTEGVTENNGWVQYTVYVKACTYASSTFTIVLGLGQGSSTDSWGYVEGYAFFDDVDMDVISNEAYDEATQNANGDYTVPYCTMTSSVNEKKFETDSAEYADEFVYALDLYQTLESFDVSENTNVTAGLTSTIVNGVAYTTANYKNLGISTEGDVTELSSWNALNGKAASNKYLSSVWADDFASEKYPFDKDEDLIFLLSAQGAAYTAKMTENNGFFTLNQDEYMLVSFWVKTSNTSGYTGATVTLYDQANTAVLGAYNTTTMSTVDLDDQEDIYDGWVQCFFFVENTSFSEKSFRLEFSYGPTTITGTTKASFCEGYAAFTGFSYYEMSELEYKNYAGTASQSTKISLKGVPETNGEGFDDVSTIDTQKIEETLANPSNYKGVNGGSIWTTENGTADAATNANENAGLLNKNYVANYSANEAAWLTNLLTAANLSVTDSLETLTWWNEIFGTSTQPLLISNVVAQSYGYFSKNYNLSANGYSTISVKVKVSEGAKAYIYLVDTSDLMKGYGSTASLETQNVSYWYDDEGNVCLSNPQDEDFNSKTGVAFYRAENGLFKNNLDDSDESYYANFANYEKDEDGNLIAATDENGDLIVVYDYAEDYVDDGVAFYYNDGTYYAYYDADKNEYSTEVKDFGEATFNGKNFTTEYARYINSDYLATLNVTTADLGEGVTVTGTADTDTYIVVDGDKPGVAGKWITVSFYLLTGSESFPYRLEVFSGSRDGKVQSAAGSYVVFDVCNSADLSSNYDGLLSEAIEEMTSVNGYTDSRLNKKVYLEEDDESGRLVYAEGDKAGQVYDNAEYYAYTFYDDAAYRRYDETLDENENGDPYANYAQSAYTETLTYLYYETQTGAEEANYCMFLNYSPIYQHVVADDGVDIDDDEEETNKWWEDPNFWLMLSSILLAVVLLIVLIIMVAIRLARKLGKKSKQDNRYNAKRMHYIRKLNLQTEEEEETPSEEAETKAEADDTENPYND